MLRKIRITLALIFFGLITLLFLDFTGTLHAWFGWLAKIQFLPAFLATNFIVVALLIILTLLFGRVYCSVICPLGVMQDLISWVSGKRKGKLYRFKWSKSIPWLRYGVLAIFVIALIAGVGSLVALLAPYSSYGRIAQNLFAPIYGWGNNLFALIAERVDSYAFYSTDVWIKSIPTFVVAAATFIILLVLAWKGGRIYCNTICPVGTILGVVSHFSFFRPEIDTDKCNGCKLCSKRCKSSCINPDEHKIDYSRCVVCMDCLEACRQGAISYKWRFSSKPKEIAPQNEESNKDNTQNGKEGVEGRRAFLAGLGMVTASAALKGQEMKVDGGLATILDKKAPKRETPIVPPGAKGVRHFYQHCTGCQLCVSVCPNGVLRPSSKLESLIQPESSYEKGYCRPECTKCSEVCPAGAIKKITTADKSAIKVGTAKWVKENCLPLTDDVFCGNCARHCPTGAITMVHSIPGDNSSPRVPAINEEKCIGCGACEYLCPSRPFSAIYVEGVEVHHEI